MNGKFDLRNTAAQLAVYAAQRQAGFENYQPGGIARQPAARHDWIRGILRGMADCAQENREELVVEFDRTIEVARSCAAVEMLPLRNQRQLVKSLCDYARELEQQKDDHRPQMLEVKNLLEDMTAYLPWDVTGSGVYQARDFVENALIRMTARRPFCFTHILLGMETGPCESDFVSGCVTDTDELCKTEIWRRLCAEYPDIMEWPVTCVVYHCGNSDMERFVRSASKLDLAIMRMAGDRFLDEPGVQWSGTMRELRIPVQPDEVRTYKETEMEMRL